MKNLIVSIILMVLLCISLFAGYIVNTFVEGSDFFASPFFIAIVCVFLVVQIICLFRRKLTAKRIGFYICHIGVVVLIIGALLSTFCCKDVNVNVPIDEYASYSEVVMEDGNVIDFGFHIGITDFSVETYEDTGEVKQCSAELTVSSDDVTVLPQTYSLEVNKPVTLNDWKFYVMGYDTENFSYVSLHAKNDIGNLPLLFGFILIPIGTFLLCFSRIKSGREEEVKKNG